MPGTNVVTTGLDHASVRSAVTMFAEKYKKEKRIAEASPDIGSVSVETILEKIDKDTCLLAVIHASNVTGEIFKVKKIVPLSACHYNTPEEIGLFLKATASVANN